MKLSLLSTSVLLLASTAPFGSAWGTLGHDTIAYVATNFVSSATKTHFQTLLGDTSANYLASVATWADSYRYTTEGMFSAPYHYIDAMDDPPASCDLSYARDCGAEGCIVSAITNYTARVRKTTLSSADRIIAAKFVGDIHQPLHDENLEAGGNGIDVIFDSDATNLHSVWDTAIAEKLVGGYALTDAQSWATNLTTAIRTGTYAPSAKSWLTGMKLSSPQETALLWAREANALVCVDVMPDGAAALEGSADLGSAYYAGVVDTVEEQVAKAGYRLAGWLNMIATGKVGL
ncbi:hypothetical protein MBM_08151 [Drepanopeziza brunnea f. sp. 'multigermtubi' MB_m1]|uniref:Nuclease s1 n=1 Tax=Marssonina brunnea f. sp. multigermtubi (strain MB_m1) TaxID=1072389 RepID=K1W9L7_MARBU|nr:uncharacterized protein MBM_08151 [Drepanopeziza brunnea f. sp. 'multigermtubi' MB_m1]EKD13950.1 hypothetical protein MBM_08151 [Drepanopeziza brunnea f. sp. 'multigermtubi' MB_m1]